MFKKELTNKGIGRFVETLSAALGRRRETSGATVTVLDIDAVPKRGPQNLAVCLDENLARSIANQKPAESSSGMIQLHKARATAAKDQ